MDKLDISRTETLKHKGQVRDALNIMIVVLNTITTDLIHRANTHDDSKLVSPEVEGFAENTENFARIEFGSPEYEAARESLKDTLDHHYAHNDHHPEGVRGGVPGMNLVQVVEMFCDWYASSGRNPQGDPRRSVEIGQQRYGFSDDLKQILLNTVDFLDQKLKKL